MSSASEMAARFDALVESYYRAWFRFHPEEAVDTGTPGYAHLLTPCRPDALGPLLCLNDELVVGLDELDMAALDEDRRIDATVLRGAAVLENTRVLEVDPQRIDPQRVLPLNAIYQLTIREVEDARGAMAARLAAVTPHLAEAREYLSDHAERIPPMWLRSAAHTAREGAGFVAGLVTDQSAAERFGLGDDSPLINHAASALSEFSEYLSGEMVARVRGEVACGSGYFDLLLKHRHFLDVSVGELRALGEALLEQTQRDLMDACRALGGSTQLADVLARVRRDHPPAAGLIGAYRQAMQAARAFVRDRGLVSMPAAESLEVVETPSFLRHQIPFAAYVEPMPGDPAQRGYYYVTPPRSDEELAEHDHAGLMHTCVHEAWPGHHLQFVAANLSPTARRLPRLLNASATMYEGWALYCEQLMHEQGFLDQPVQRVLLLRDRLWRALRILIDIDLHTAGFSTDDAAARLVQHLGFSPSQALGEITWYTRSPTVPLGYAVGWSFINALRDRLRAEEPATGLRAFHDRLLSVGSIGLPLVITRAFGEKRWHAVRHMLFA